METNTTNKSEILALPMAEFGSRWGLSYRQTAKWVREGKIPCLDLGYHCKRVPVAEGDAAIRKLAGGGE